MSSGLLEWVSGISSQKETGFGIAPGVVRDNFNLLSEGRVEVHITSHPEFNPMARILGLGGGSGRGFLWAPQVDDEVLVAFNKNDHRDAYILGGLWSTMNRPPGATTPIDFITKKVIKTGVKDSPLAHSIEIDDALQSITIKTSTEQQITIDPKKIEISATKGVHTISMNLVAVPPSIEISTKGDIKLSAPTGKISLEALQLELSGDVSTSLTSNGEVTVQGLTIQLN